MERIGRGIVENRARLGRGQAFYRAGVEEAMHRSVIGISFKHWILNGV